MQTDLDGTPRSEKLEVNMDSLNLLINFLSQLCDQDDNFSSSRVLKKSPLFKLGHISLLQASKIAINHMQKCNEQQATVNLLNVHQIQQTPMQKYLESYQKQSKVVKR